jgi:hypothetical protein
MADVIETDLTTDPPSITERDFTPVELAQREADLIAQETAEAERIANEEATAQATAAAIAHAKSLGFTDQMISVMYPNLGA